MITFEWQCACGITIKTTQEEEMDMAKDKHYQNHAINAGWSLTK